MTILKRSFTEMQKYDCSLRLTVNTAKALYQELKLDILNTADIQVQISMNKKQILDLHKKMFHYWQGKMANGILTCQRKELKPQRANK